MHNFWVVSCLFMVPSFVTASKEFYDLSIELADKKVLQFEKLKGKVVLLVNVASQCGYTEGDYTFLSSLYDELSPTGKFEILAFPCNQFGGQEPWAEEEIVDFVKKEYDVKFPLTKKIDVKGANAHDVWKFIKDKSGVSPSWNFFKHLFDHTGNLVGSFPTGYDQKEIRAAVNKAMTAANNEGSKKEL